ncbi:hypothetical protein GJ744_005907 [Endocarpon pusillum]|uniref:Uncharacterized protein n=1 Tax=Endocarpon pusillum TaxID=364733 RepID=A0A8H7E665_9EURO|nr:hypothetical protein GJ744_005907 [Endocarpon pusillum]
MRTLASKDVMVVPISTSFRKVIVATYLEPFNVLPATIMSNPRKARDSESYVLPQPLALFTYLILYTPAFR